MRRLDINGPGDPRSTYWQNRLTPEESLRIAGHYLGNVRCEALDHREKEVPCAACREWGERVAAQACVEHLRKEV